MVQFLGYSSVSVVDGGVEYHVFDDCMAAGGMFLFPEYMVAGGGKIDFKIFRGLVEDALKRKTLLSELNKSGTFARSGNTYKCYVQSPEHPAVKMVYQSSDIFEFLKEAPQHFKDARESMNASDGVTITNTVFDIEVMITDNAVLEEGKFVFRNNHKALDLVNIGECFKHSAQHKISLDVFIKERTGNRQIMN